MKAWVAFSSSSGETFRKVYEQLSKEAQQSCLGFFTDRDCAATTVGEKLLGKEKCFSFEKNEFEEKVLAQLEKLDLHNGLIFLCGFFGILSAEFIQNSNMPIVNTHPSLLPAYPGLDKKVNRLAYENNPISGFTLHMVTEELDGGPILFQHSVEIATAKDLDESRSRVRALEQKHLPQDLEKILNSNLVAEDRNRKFRDLVSLLKF